MSSTANTDVDPQPLDSSELPIISTYIPTLPEALIHLDNLTTFSQRVCLSLLLFFLPISDLLHTMSQAQEGLKHHQCTKKIQTSLKDSWSSGIAN